MSLSVYDPEKGVFVLNPKKFVINAFHPDYIKTHMPQFLSTMRIESSQKTNGTINGSKSRVTREAKRGKTVNTININPKPKFNIAPMEFHVYSKAGLPTKLKEKNA